METRQKILIIDDDADLVEALKIVLEAKGYEVHCAYEGSAGYWKAVRLLPDLIILDVMMKTKDEGFQISYKLKSNLDTRGIPIMMLTSVGKETGFSFTKEDADYLKADEFVDKPIKPSELLKKVKAMIKSAAVP